MGFVSSDDSLAFVSTMTDFVVSTTNNRRVLGSMNDLIFQVTNDLATFGGWPRVNRVELAHRLTHIPMGAIKYQFPDQLMKKDLVTAFGAP